MSERQVHAQVVAVVGPTAVGKSRLAEDLAVLAGGEIVSADSMQVYRGMDIGTAKTPVCERRVPYHCIDLVDPGQEYSAALYQRDARRAIDSIRVRGALPVLVGGTGLYVRAALDSMEFPAGDLSTPLRTSLEQEAERIGGPAMHAKLAALDPDAAALIHVNNIRRVVRAIEMVHEGTSYASQAQEFAHREPYYEARFLGMALPRLELYERIGRRVDLMLEQGLLGEIEGLLASGYSEALTSSQAIGYKEFLPVIRGEIPLAEAAEAVKQATRRYAKRQLTWFRADDRVSWIDVTDLSPSEALSRASDLLESGEPAPYPFGAGE